MSYPKHSVKSSGVRNAPFYWPVREHEHAMFEEALKKLEAETSNIETLYIGAGKGTAPYGLYQRNNEIHNLSTFWHIVDTLKRKEV